MRRDDLAVVGVTKHLVEDRLRKEEQVWFSESMQISVRNACFLALECAYTL